MVLADFNSVFCENYFRCMFADLEYGFEGILHNKKLIWRWQDGWLTLR
jgi:hypothetical protein